MSNQLPHLTCGLILEIILAEAFRQVEILHLISPMPLQLPATQRFCILQLIPKLVKLMFIIYQFCGGEGYVGVNPIDTFDWKLYDSFTIEDSAVKLVAVNSISYNLAVAPNNVSRDVFL